MFDNSSILITGGTGSFGNAFVKKILDQYSPKRVVIFSRDEFKQYEMQQRLKKHPALRFFLGSVRDPHRLQQAMEDIDYVVHAAALKQVPALEYNPIEAVRTNILGAEHVIQAASHVGVKKVVALSTDKAANPINLYGATKLASDKLFVAANNTMGKKPTEFSVVRYGNVLNSRGSVIPYFRKLIQEGETTLPITDPRMTRFWITLNQGVEFVLESFKRMQGGEIFVPKIPSMNIMDLVQAIAPDAQTEIIGIRPGEKLHEIMCPMEMSKDVREFDDHYVIAPSFRFNRGDINYKENQIGEAGQDVSDDFEYSSATNPHFLSVEEMRELLQKTDAEKEAA